MCMLFLKGIIVRSVTKEHVYVNRRKRIHIYEHVYANTSIRVHIYEHVYVNKRERVYIYEHLYVKRKRVHIYEHAYVNKRKGVHIYLHIYISFEHMLYLLVRVCGFCARVRVCVNSESILQIFTDLLSVQYSN